MCNATIKQTKTGWMVLVNGEFYGEYSTPEKAEEIRDSFKGQLAN